MSKKLGYYLKEIQGISDMQKFLAKYKRHIVIRDPIQQQLGMTIFNKMSNIDDFAFIFEFDT